MSGAAWGAYDVTVRFGRRAALSGATLVVQAGAVTAVYGADGAGKTTLLRTLAGGLRPVAGAVQRPPRTRIGYVAGASGLYADLSVAENIAFAAEAYGLREPALGKRTRELLAETGLEGTEGRLAGRLSGGMRQKLAVTLAMLHEPQLLILDEPTTGLDPVSRAELWRLIADAAAAGAAVVVSTSYPDEAERAATVVTIEDGRTTDGTAGEDEPGRAPPPATTVATLRPPADGSAAPLAAAHGLTRRFGSFVAVAGVDLQVQPGEVVGLLGANGAGKTTLIRLLLGLLAANEGSVRLFGRVPSRETRRRLGYVPQGLGLWEDLTVAENLAFVARSFGHAAAAPPPDLAAVAQTVVRDLPLGLRRRLAFAAALAHEPELLVLDEPTSGCDAQARRQLWATIHAAAAAGAGVLVTTHRMEEAGQCDRLIIMAAGRVVAAGTLAEIVGDRVAVEVVPEHWDRAYAALTRAGFAAALVGRALRVCGASAGELRAVLAAAGLAAAVRDVPATLEETFVALVTGSGDA